MINCGKCIRLRQRSLATVTAAIALTVLDGCALRTGESASVVPPQLVEVAPPVEDKAEENDPVSQAITTAIATLLAADLAKSAIVANALGVNWSVATEDPLAGGIYRGRAKDLPLTSVQYERWIIKPPHQASLTMELDQGHCYAAHALVFNFAPEHVASPYSLADGEEAHITARALFVSSDKKVLLAYRRGPTNGRNCVADVTILQPAN